MTAELAKPTSTVTKPAATADTDRSRTSDMDAPPTIATAGRPGPGIGYTRRNARVSPFAARADRPGRLPLADRRLLPRAARRRSGAPVPADGHPGQGPERVPRAP